MTESDGIAAIPAGESLIAGMRALVEAAQQTSSEETWRFIGLVGAAGFAANALIASAAASGRLEDVPIDEVQAALAEAESMLLLGLSVSDGVAAQAPETTPLAGAGEEGIAAGGSDQKAATPPSPARPPKPLESLIPGLDSLSRIIVETVREQPKTVGELVLLLDRKGHNLSDYDVRALLDGLSAVFVDCSDFDLSTGAARRPTEALVSLRPAELVPEQALRKAGDTGEGDDTGIEQQTPRFDTDWGLRLEFLGEAQKPRAVLDDKLWCRSPDQRLMLDNEHPVIKHLFYSKPFRRMQAIEQLSLPPQYSIIPNTAAFSGFESLLGGIMFTSQMAEKEHLSEEEKVRQQVEVMLSDFAHTVGRHRGDHMFQGIGGPEDLHDQRLGMFLEVTGVMDILRHFNIDPADVVNPPKASLAQIKRPDICTDNIDYVVREANRSNEAFRHMDISVEDFVLTPEGIAAMTSLQRARAFAEADMLLSQLNWGSAPHRVIEALLMVRSKLYYIEGGAPDMYVFPGVNEGPVILNDIHPHDLMYVTDPVELAGFTLPSPAGNLIDTLMADIAAYQRQFVWPIRQERQRLYMQQFTDPKAYEAVLQKGAYVPFNSRELGLNFEDDTQGAPPLLRLMDVEEARRTATDEYIDIVMDTPFKLRQSDPLVKTADGFHRLSELDSSYRKRMQEHQAAVTRSFVARLYIPYPEERALLREALDTIDARWEKHLEGTRRLTPQEFKALVDASANYIHGQYSFMTFSEY